MKFIPVFKLKFNGGMETIYELNIYLENHQGESTSVIDDNFVMTRDFIGYRNSDMVFNILAKHNYTVVLMKEKIFKYIEHIQKQVDDSLNQILFNPFVIEYSVNGQPVYDQQKYYDGGMRRYKSYIYCYEYHPISSRYTDYYKIKKIKKLFNDFFYLKNLFRDGNMPDECVKLIWSYCTGYGNTIMDDCIWSLKKIIRDDVKSKFKDY